MRDVLSWPVTRLCPLFARSGSCRRHTHLPHARGLVMYAARLHRLDTTTMQRLPANQAPARRRMAPHATPQCTLKTGSLVSPRYARLAAFSPGRNRIDEAAAGTGRYWNLLNFVGRDPSSVLACVRRHEQVTNQ